MGRATLLQTLLSLIVTTVQGRVVDLDDRSYDVVGYGDSCDRPKKSFGPVGPSPGQTDPFLSVVRVKAGGYHLL